THLLLQAFEQKPKSKDGWLTISEVHSFVTEAIKTQPRASQIQARSATVNPNLPLVQNPRYSPASREFAEQVKQLLQLTGYQPTKIKPAENAPANFYVAEVKAGRNKLKVGVIPFYDEVQELSQQQAKFFAI